MVPSYAHSTACCSGTATRLISSVSSRSGLRERQPPGEKEPVRRDHDFGELIDHSKVDQLRRVDAGFLPQLAARRLLRVFTVFDTAGEGFQAVAIEGVAIDAHEVDCAILVDWQDRDPGVISTTPKVPSCPSG